MQPPNDLELTVLMPCLNEAETLATCIKKAKSFLHQHQVNGEVLIADNGSTDDSIDIAIEHGARVERVEQKGYGAALLGGISSAKGSFVIMGDADDSYDFTNLEPFLRALREGSDLVMGNRFTGGIKRGAMPLLHKYLGNPVLSWIGRLFFRIPVKDFHCGLRGFNLDRIRSLGLQTSGMEFASEMVVKAALRDLKITEVPTTLHPDGRSRPPHLKTWSDGWRHLVFLLMFSPKWLFLYPGAALAGCGLLSAVALSAGSVTVGNVGFDIHTFAVGCAAITIGVQSMSFAVVARKYCTEHGMMPHSERFHDTISKLNLNTVLPFCAAIALTGVLGVFWCLIKWHSLDFGDITQNSTLRVLVASLTATTIGFQLALTAFISSILEIPISRS